MTVLKRCTCKHEYQDKRYGKGVRVMNERKSSKNSKGPVCTVCGKEYN